MTERLAIKKAIWQISIHIPRVGDDGYREAMSSEYKVFQSTSPVWGMTFDIETTRLPEIISIHIPRVGDDLKR